MCGATEGVTSFPLHVLSPSFYQSMLDNITEVWIRSESASQAPRGARPDLAIDRRTPLTPQWTAYLIENDISVTVECSTERAYQDEEYDRCGCRMVATGSWTSAPKSALILGLRLPEPLPSTISHAHAFFCHAYKGQPNWHRRLLPFLKGDSVLYDLEYLVDENGQRLASFGQTAGSIGLATGLFAWSRQVLANRFPGVSLPSNMLSGMTMNSVETLLRMAEQWTQQKPRCLVIGANGRCGRGAVDFAASANVEIVCWTRADTARGGPFPELLDFDIVINAIRIDSGDASLFQPWLTNELIRREPRRLSVIVDISCEPNSMLNPFPLYKQATSFERPTLTLIEAHDGHSALDLIAIPNLPSLLPVDSSNQFSAQLAPLLFDLLIERSAKVLLPAGAAFHAAVSPLVIPTLSNNAARVPAADTEEISFDAVALADGFNFDSLRSAVEQQIKPMLKSIISGLEFGDKSGGGKVVLQDYDFVNRCDDIRDIQLVYMNLMRNQEYALTRERPLHILVSRSHLSVAAHGAILDQISVTLLAKYLAEGDFSLTKSSLSNLQYCDYARWFAERLEELKTGNDHDGLLLFRDDQQYWKQTLLAGDGQIVSAQLPMDLSPSPMSWKFTTQKRHTVPLLSSVLHYPMPVQALAALSLIIYRRTNEPDFVIGTRASFRNRYSLKHIFGPFEDRSILRLSLDKDMTVKALLEQCMRQWEGVALHQELPLRHLNTDYAHQNIEFIAESELSERFNLTEPQGSYQIRFRLWPNSFLSIDYDPGTFLPESITELANQICLIISELNESLHISTLDVKLTTRSARHLLPDPTQPLDSSYPGPITEVFKENCLKTPEAIAISSEDVSITYGRLYEHVSWLAGQLRSAGIRRGDIVAIYGDRVPSVVWAIMGVLFSGAALSMMDPRYPTERLIACLGIAKPRAWIAVKSAGEISSELSSFLDKDLNLVAKIILPPLDETTDVLSLRAAAPTEDLELRSDNVGFGLEIDQDDIAVVTFTSGSTGLPKGVCGRHGPLTHFYPWMREKFQFSNKDHFSMCSGIAHDPLQRDIFTPLFFGARICIPSDSTIREGRLSQWMEHARINVSCLTPAMGQLLTASYNSGDTPPLECLRSVFFVGDCLMKSDVIRLRTMAPNATLVNMYGSTETQRAVGHLVVPVDINPIKDVVPVGAGMCDVQLLVINEAGKLAAIGERGEIYVRSPHLARGYLGLSEQTAEKFILNQFLDKPDPHDRMYRTGDLGQYNSRGWVECCGRSDDQVKIRGFRIELGEINARLSRHPYVKECVTIVVNEDGDKLLVSFVVLNIEIASRDKDVEDIVAVLKVDLQSSLPHYMVPAAIHIISSMPLTPNGKINRSALRAPRRESMHQPPAILNNTQEKIVQVWNRLLPNVGEVNIDANFFDLGGHSLLATRLIMELSRSFHLTIPLQTLFTNATIRSLAEAIDSLGGDRKCDDQNKMPNLIEDVNYNWCSDIEIAIQKPNDEVKNVLLTGCTGFVGCYLLVELLQCLPTAQIHCTVRAESGAAGMIRICKALQSHLLWRDEFQNRITPIISDFSKPNAGWTDETVTEICSKIDIIVHNAAHVHWLLPYDRLRAVNVSATEFFLKIAANLKLKPFHFISTTSVLESAQNKDSSKKMLLLESALNDNFRGLSSGYAQSKWVAEKLVSEASSKGITANIYRLGYVTGDSRTGISNTDDFLVRLMQGCIELGSCPFMEFVDGDRGFTIDMSPADYVAKTVVEIVTHKKSAGRVFHVTSPNPLPFLSFFQQIKDYGYELVNLPYATWRQKLLESVARNEPNALTPIVSYLTENWTDDLAKGLQLDRSNVLELSSTKFPCLDRIVHIYLSYLVRCGAIPAPRDAPDDHLQIDWSAITAQVHRVTRTQRS